MSLAIINATVRIVGNDTDFVDCNTLMTIDCNKATFKGHWYMEPMTSLAGIIYSKQPDNITPSPYAVEVVEIEYEGQSVYVSSTIATWETACNTCCGSTPTISPIAVPVFVPNNPVCKDDDGNCIMKWFVPTLASGQTFKLGIYVAGVAGSPALSTALTSPAGALTYAQTNWSAYGTWTIEDTNFLVLTSTAYCDVNLLNVPQTNSFCITVAYPFTFDEITRSGDGGTTVSIPLPNGDTTVGDEAALDAAIEPYFTDGTVTHATAGKVQYAGTGRPNLLKLNGSTVGTWTTAACS